MELEHYVSIKNPQNIKSYGGNQGWLIKNSAIKNYGCGVIAVGDFFLFLALQKQEYRTFETQIAYRNGELRREDYIQYIEYIHKHYIRAMHILGTLGPDLARAINRYCQKYHIKYHAAWQWHLSGQSMLEKIEEMLEHHLPVIFSVGPNTPDFWGTKEVSLYNSNFQRVQGIKGHYMTITGIAFYNHQRMLQVASWGECFFIDYEEYRNYAETVGDQWTSSIIYIEKF